MFKVIIFWSVPHLEPLIIGFTKEETAELIFIDLRKLVGKDDAYSLTSAVAGSPEYIINCKHIAYVKKKKE